MGNFLGKISNAGVSKFSTIYKVKASNIERKHMRAEVLDKAFDTLINNKSDKISLKSIENFFKKNLPEINVEIKSMPNDNKLPFALTNTRYDVTKYGEPAPIKLHQLMFRDNGKGFLAKTSDNINAIMHETSHFLDGVFNIKKPIGKQLTNPNQQKTRYVMGDVLEVSSNTVYKKDIGAFNSNHFKAILKLSLGRKDILTPEARLDALKLLYREAKSEKDAYHIGIKYLNKFNGGTKEEMKAVYDKAYGQKNYHFNEKTKALKEMVKDEIRLQREALHAKTNKT